MPSEQRQDGRHNAYAQVITGVATSIIAAAVLWMAASVADLQKSGAVTSEQVSQIKAEITDISDRLASLYPEADAEREFKRIDDKLTDHEIRIRRLEVQP